MGLWYCHSKVQQTPPVEGGTEPGIKREGGNIQVRYARGKACVPPSAAGVIGRRFDIGTGYCGSS